MAAQDMLDDRQAQAGAAKLPRARRLDPKEALGQARQMLGRDALALESEPGSGTVASVYLPVGETEIRS